MDDVRNIMLAAESGNMDKMREYILSEAIDIMDEEGSTPLMYAAANGQEKVVRLLLQSDVDVDQQNHYGWTALLQASCYGHHEVVYTLLQNKADINMYNKWEISPLVAAAQGGFTTVVKVLLEKGATVTTSDEVPSISPLMAAAQCGSESIIKLLLDHGSNPNTRLMTTGWTALMLASLNNHAPVIKELLRRGAVREMRDVNNNRAMDLASELGLTSVVAILSEDVTTVPSSNIDIFEAVKLDSVDMLVEIIKKHKVSTTVTDKDGATPLMYAARKGNLKACEILLSDGADVDAQDHIHRWTAFMHAVHHKHYEIAQLLAQYGANVNLRAKNGSSAFDIANLIGDTRTIQLIAQITIQRLTEKEEKSQPPGEDDPEKFPMSPVSPAPTHLSPPPSSDQEEDDEVVSILRRVSNAYLASGGPKLPNPKDMFRPGSHSPFAQQTPSPDFIEEETVLPATTRPVHFSPTKNTLSPSPDSNSSPSPLLRVPQRPGLGGKKKAESPQPSFLNDIQNKKSLSPPSSFSPSARPNSIKKPNLHLNLSPFAEEQSKSVSSNRFVSSNRDTPHIKSPRSLPTNTFNFLKSPANNHLKSGSFLRRDNSSSKFRLSPNFSSSGEKTRPLGSSGRRGDDGGRSKIQLKYQEPKRTQFNSSSAKIASFDKIKFPCAQKGLDLNTVLNNASLGHYYSVFEEEEMDINSFLTLTESELIEIGVKDTAERNRMIALIVQLKEQPPPRSPLSPKPFANFKFH